MTSSFWVFLSEYPGNYTAIDGKLLLVYACEKISRLKNLGVSYQKYNKTARLGDATRDK